MESTLPGSRPFIRQRSTKCVGLLEIRLASIRRKAWSALLMSVSAFLCWFFVQCASGPAVRSPGLTGPTTSTGYPAGEPSAVVSSHFGIAEMLTLGLGGFGLGAFVWLRREMRRTNSPTKEQNEKEEH